MGCEVSSCISYLLCLLLSRNREALQHTHDCPCIWNCRLPYCVYWLATQRSLNQNLYPLHINFDESVSQWFSLPCSQTICIETTTIRTFHFYWQYFLSMAVFSATLRIIFPKSLFTSASSTGPMASIVSFKYWPFTQIPAINKTKKS